MTLRLDQESWLIDLIDLYNNDPDQVPGGFETNFLTDVAERYVSDEENFFISPKMMNILKRIGEDRYGMNWKEYED